MNQPVSAARAGVLRRAWVRLFGESDPIERQLAAIAREGATLARLAHVCAFLMLILFSAGSLVALAGDSIAAIAAGHATLPAIIAAGVSGLLVACMDTAMLYAASILRMLAARHADKREGRLHRWVLFGVAILEAATYGYMSWLYERPSGVAWALIGARALAAPLLSVYLSLARPLPVMARDMLALGERIGGEGVLRDLARIAGDASAPLADKVRLYMAAALIATEDERRLRALLDVAQDRVTSPANASSGTISNSQLTPGALDGVSGSPSDDSTRPPTGPGSPAQRRRAQGDQQGTDNVVEMPQRRRRTRKSASGRARVRTPGKAGGVRTATVEAKARAAYRPGMSVTELQEAAGISRSAAGKYRRTFLAEGSQNASGEQVAQ